MITFENYSEPRYITNGGIGFVIGKTEVMLELFHYLNRLANLHTTVLVRGETGTGKELFAKALHYNRSNNRNGYFVAVNCAGIPSELLESELFGYVKGAFTGAYKDTIGKFQYANSGTIFLDEIGDMSLSLQAKILRVLQERQVTRIGSNEPEKVDVRVVAATNKDLEEAIKKGSFREDLFYRLNVVPISIPPLRERRDDIPLIAQYFIEKYNGIYGVNIEDLSEGAKEKLKSYDWKGNVRELENVVERAFVKIDDRKEGEIQANDIVVDGQLPQRRIVQIPSERKYGKTLSLSGEPLKSKLWYEEGVLPIIPTNLSRFEGTKSYGAIYYVHQKLRIYTEVINLKNKGTRVMYLTPDSVFSFFVKTNPDLIELQRKIKEGEFNEIAKNPFKIFNIELMHSNPNTFSDHYLIEEAIKKSNAYIIPSRRDKLFVVTEDIAEVFVPFDQDRRKSIEALISELNENYQRFQMWTPTSN